jgi:hypothetical protein
VQLLVLSVLTLLGPGVPTLPLLATLVASALLADVGLLRVVLLLVRGRLPLAVLVEPVVLPLEVPRRVGAALAAAAFADPPVPPAVLVGVGLLARVPVLEVTLSVLAALLALPVRPVALLAAGRTDAASLVVLPRVRAGELPALVVVQARPLPVPLALATLVVAVGLLVPLLGSALHAGPRPVAGRFVPWVVTFRVVPPAVAAPRRPGTSS